MLFLLLLSMATASVTASAWRVPVLPHHTAEQSQVQVVARQQNVTAWPYGPYRTRGREIIDARGMNVTWAGVNWPLHGESMIPEGLEYTSVQSILDRVVSVGFNIIRMPFAIQMIDTLYANNQTDIPFPTILSQALGPANGSAVAAGILRNNPIWTNQTGILKIWTDIARIAAGKRLLIHPDAHVSRAGGCCSHVDGNAWFGDTHFPVANWTRGLIFVARWASNHTNVLSIGLRNEPRESWSSTADNVNNRAELGYNWLNLAGNMTMAADAVHAVNPNLLMTWSGMGFGQDVSALVTRGKENLLTAPCYRCSAIRDAYRREPVVFDLSQHPWADKVVWELHLDAASEDMDTGSCRVIEAGLYRSGMNTLGIAPPAACNITGGDCLPAKRLTPVVLSEVGGPQDGRLLNDTLVNCLRQYTVRNRVPWMMWSLAGTYRILSGVQGARDSWGLLNATWDGFQFPEAVERLWRPWVNGTY